MNRQKTFTMYLERCVCVLITVFFGAAMFSSCEGGSSLSSVEGDTLSLKYAEHICIVKYDGFTSATLLDPWNEGKVLHTYFLVPKGEAGDRICLRLNEEGATHGIVDIVRTPIDRSIVFTSAHCQLLYELDVEEAITGVCDLNYINIQDIHNRKDIVDCGQGMQPMVEKIMDSKAEALLISPFENSGGYGKLDKMGIPIIETADYVETSALGRAEWMKFYGMLYGCEEKADSLFEQIDKEYLRLKTLASRLPLGRSILTERKTGSVWYSPGGRSTMGVMFRDANARYAFSDDKNSGSLSNSVEQILDKAGDTEVWAFKYLGDKPLSRSDLLQEYHGYEAMKAFRTGEIYECNTSKVPYFEEVGFHPEYLLKELIQLTHPGVNLGGLRYYIKLK